MVTSGIQKSLRNLGVSRKLSVRILGATAAAAATVLTTAVALAQSNVIQIDGSSTVFPITEAMAEEFMTTNSDVNISVGVSGTGGGFKKFCAGETAIANASRPIKDSEIELCKTNGIEYEIFPVAYDALTVVINPSNTWAESLTVEQLKEIWEPAAEGTITNWNQIDPSFPDAPLNLYGPGTDSGTFDYFTEEIVGESAASRGDYTASEDDNVLVLGVEGDRNALGYFGMSYYLENEDRLKAVGIISEDTNGVAVIPSAETIEQYKPLARTIYIYVNKQDLSDRPEVNSFVRYYLENAETIVPEVSYIPLPASNYATSLGKLASADRSLRLGSLRAR
ncbi:MAG: protein sphX [Phormidesmis priestleyi]|uniref:Phosphate-binding protein n=1 Tax=Phormidesmis priestleyi TaxID=268141 RepID=A0A2W4WQ75_9CYAN|nr:MAG: protein sphX [Phormidesmis priestleyi]